MTTRTRVINYLRVCLRAPTIRHTLGINAADLRRRHSPIATSRHYPPADSWTGRAAWAISIAEAKLDGTGKLVFLCEREDGDGFHVLGVPKEWLRTHRASFAFSHSHCRLFLSAEPGELSCEVRGTGSVEFAPWVVDHDIPG